MKNIIRLLFVLQFILISCTKIVNQNIIIQKGKIYFNTATVDKNFKVLFLADTHFTVEDGRGRDYYKYSKRMGGNAVEPLNYGNSNGNEQFLIASLEKAKRDSIELVILGGDIINFPSAASVEYIHEILNNSGLNWVYIAGNHDWHYEGEPGKAIDQRTKWEQTTLKPLFKGKNPLYHSLILHQVNFVFIDNSTNEITNEQLQFLKTEISKEMPIVLFMHIPIYFPMQNIDYGCGHPNWNEKHDIYYKIERRLPWPKTGHSATTLKFRELVVENEKIIGIFAGHTHYETIDVSNNKIQYVVGSNSRGEDVTIHFIKQ